MKKTAISLLLVLAMVLCTVLVAAPKAEAVEHEAATAANTHTHDSTWTKLTSSMTTLSAGKYYVDVADLTMAGTIIVEEGANVTICLNGNILRGSDDDNTTRLFTLEKENVTLNLCDCSANRTGKIYSSCTGSTAGVIYIHKTTAVVNIFGGTMYGTENVAAGGAIRVRTGTLNMYGGTITGGSGTYGGNVAAYSYFNMYGGTISNGSSSNKGGNIYVGGTMKLYGGVITGGDGIQHEDIYVTSAKTLEIENVDQGFKLFYNDTATIETKNMDASVKLTTAADTLISVTKTLTLTQNTAVDLVLMGDMIIDLNGFALEGNIETGNYKLYIADSSATEAGTAGTGSVSAAIAEKVSIQETGKRFVLVNGVAHRIYIGVTDVSLVLDGKNVGMGYTTGFKADADVAALIDSFGIEVYLKGGTPVPCSKDGSAFVAGTAGNKVTAHVNNILKDGTDVANLATEVCAKTFVVIDGQKIYSNEYAFSLQTIMQQMDAKGNELPEAAANLLAEIESYYGADFFAAN